MCSAQKLHSSIVQSHYQARLRLHTFHCLDLLTHRNAHRGVGCAEKQLSMAQTAAREYRARLEEVNGSKVTIASGLLRCSSVGGTDGFSIAMLCRGFAFA